LIEVIPDQIKHVNVILSSSTKVVSWWPNLSFKEISRWNSTQREGWQIPELW